METRNMISAFAALNNAFENAEMKKAAKEVLTIDDYDRFIKSYNFMFWFQLLGSLGGLLIPSIILVLITKDIAFLAFGAMIGIFWICIWLPISLLMPQGKTYSKFAKWYRKGNGSREELEKIFRAS